jgi:hypothetical protein
MLTVVRRLILWGVAVVVLVVVAAFIEACQETPMGDPKAYDVQRADVTVDVQPDASLIVTERLTFEFSGSFSGAYRDIPLQPGVRLSDVSLSDRALGRYRPGGTTALGSLDAPGKVGVEDLPGGGKRVVWHYEQTDGTRPFTLRYRIRGAVKAYDDTIVVPWAVWGDQWDFWLDHLSARIRVARPAAGDGTPIDAWMRPDDRNVEPTRSAQGAAIAFDRSAPHQQVALTAAFKRSVVSSTAGARRSSGNGLAVTRAAEEEASGSALARLGSKVAEIQVPLLVLWTALLGLAAAWLFRTAREVDPGVPEHVAGPPADLPPAVGYALAHEGDFDDRIVLATLLDLVDRGYFTAEPTEGKELDLRLAVAPSRPALDALQPYERKVLEFFDLLLADGGPCELGKLKDRIPEHSSTWRERWNAMVAALDEAGDDLIAWDRDLRGRRLGIAAVGIAGYLLLLWAGYQRTGFWSVPVAAMLAGLGLLFLLPSSWLQRREPAAMRSGAEWAAFAKWTNDFPRLEDDPPATLALWRRVLVYAVAFGTADRVVKSGRIPAPVQQEDDGWSRGLTHGATYGALSGSSFGSGFSSQVAPQSSSSSGGGGGGGGFSGGGGGGAW